MNFGPKFAQKWILGSEIQKSKSGFGISTSNVPCVPIFSQNRQLLIFWPKFGENAQLRAIFWFKYCWGCYRELGGGWNELGGGGWSWVKVGARFSNTLTFQLNNLWDQIHVIKTWLELLIKKHVSRELLSFKSSIY